MTPRRRLTPDQRRAELIGAGAELFARLPYDEVSLDDVAARAGVSRALVYRHFGGKSELFTAVYRRAADQLMAATTFDSRLPLAEQIEAGLAAHFDYFQANRNTVLAANRVLAGSPEIESIIADELAQLAHRLVMASGVRGDAQKLLAAAVSAWLTYVRVLCVEWLTHQAFSRRELHDLCIGALQGAVGSILDLDKAPQFAGPHRGVKRARRAPSTPR